MQKPNLLLGITALAAMVTTAQAQNWLTNGLLAYYPFNGNGNDASGNGNNLSLSSQTFIPDATGIAGKAIYFDYNTAVTIPNSESWNHTQYTVALWVNLDSSGVTSYAWPQPAAKRFDGSGGYNVWAIGPYMYGLLLTNDGWSCAIELANQQNPVLISQLLVVPNQWVHLCMTVDEAGIAFYLNGRSEARTNYSGQRLASANPITIGGNSSGMSEQTWNGGIDQFRYYNRALSSNQVAELYAIESAPTINIHKAVYLDSSNLAVGTNYRIQTSSDLLNWTNQGPVFTATNTYWRSTNYYDVENWGKDFFRLQAQ